jgi:uncharacterized membrane protein HdeD (DUF308 family)
VLIERPIAYAALGLGAALALPQWNAIQSVSGAHSPAALLIAALFGAMAVFLGVRLAQSHTDPRARRWRLILWGTISALIALFLLLVAIQVEPIWERTADVGAALLVLLAFLYPLRH